MTAVMEKTGEGRGVQGYHIELAMVLNIVSNSFIDSRQSQTLSGTLFLDCQSAFYTDVKSLEQPSSISKKNRGRRMTLTANPQTSRPCSM